MNIYKIAKIYLPSSLSKRDHKTQQKLIIKSRKSYKKHKYDTRKKVASFTSKKSRHIRNAERIYKLDKITPSKSLSLATGCSVNALQQIVRKGEGAYYSSGSRPNQTAKSWGLARLASSITGGHASKYDYKILEDGCNHSKRAYVLATKAKKSN